MWFYLPLKNRGYSPFHNPFKPDSYFQTSSMKVTFLFVLNITIILALQQSYGELVGVEILHIFSNVSVEDPCCQSLQHGSKSTDSSLPTLQVYIIYDQKWQSYIHVLTPWVSLITALDIEYVDVEMSKWLNCIQFFFIELVCIKSLWEVSLHIKVKWN